MPQIGPFAGPRRKDLLQVLVYFSKSKLASEHKKLLDTTRLQQESVGPSLIFFWNMNIPEFFFEIFLFSFFQKGQTSYDII